MYYLLLALAVIKSTLACPQHDIRIHNNFIGKRAAHDKDWNYETSFNWGKINADYTACQTGTNQSPIPLTLTQGISQVHIPTFNYGTPVAGNVYNWEHGPSFTADTNATSLTQGASVTFDNQTVYFQGWHIHAPADHSVQGVRSKAELHLVHANAYNKTSAVVAILIDPGNVESAFASQFLKAPCPSFNSTDSVPVPNMDLSLAIQEAGNFTEFWTYDGSLTSPPCTEGVRFFVSRSVMTVSNQQMQDILKNMTRKASAIRRNPSIG
ncbi:hypothetical protein HYFRA_00003625 [Hymenoscyphus fraxineus]|uniref:Alpha-carbonic anhydrase domain-containing protein n=1 Tax=Hymenoscyphus fraxineus TaxID=746836 RepID=A0A9N9KXM2_9HELO|nr:hypothetical protein HYFRA_00003625 [Hymenoscyphus fraxineus]